MSYSKHIFSFLILSLFSFFVTGCITLKKASVPMSIIEVPRKGDKPSIKVGVNNLREISGLDSSLNEVDAEMKAAAALNLDFSVYSLLSIGVGTTNATAGYVKFEVPLTQYMTEVAPHWRLSGYAHQHFYKSLSDESFTDQLTLVNVGSGVDNGFTLGREFGSSVFVYFGVANLNLDTSLINEIAKNSWVKATKKSKETNFAFGLALGDKDQWDFSIGQTQFRWTGSSKTINKPYFNFNYTMMY